MSGIGFFELLILFLIGLIVLGPERLPRVANQIGTWLGQARRMTRVMKRQLEEELDFDKPAAPRAPTPADRNSYSPAPEQPTVTGFDAVKVHPRADGELASAEAEAEVEVEVENENENENGQPS
jgi:Tat protein translocase TatB subunit